MKVVVFTNNYSIVLRWSYLGKRYSISVGPINAANFKFASLLQSIIEVDVKGKKLDIAYYKKLITENKPDKPAPGKKVIAAQDSFLYQFQHYVDMTGNMGKKFNKLFITLKMLESFGDIPIEQIIPRMQAKKYTANTYNERLSCLRKVAGYLVRIGKLKYNFFSEVSGMRKNSRTLVPERMPFSIEETNRILQALKESTNNRNGHYYYPFVKFLFMTGVRNAEAIGLTIEKINFIDKSILINQSYARTENGHHHSARVMKPTKTGNARYIPITTALEELLMPLIHEKGRKDFVFLTPKGNPIDDHQFQIRIWNQLLHDLGISHRNLYACRHTFGTRCSEQGMNPKEIQYLMGHADVRITLDVYVTLTTRVNKLPSMFEF